MNFVSGSERNSISPPQFHATPGFQSYCRSLWGTSLPVVPRYLSTLAHVVAGDSKEKSSGM